MAVGESGEEYSPQSFLINALILREMILDASQQQRRPQQQAQENVEEDSEEEVEEIEIKEESTQKKTSTSIPRNNLNKWAVQQDPSTLRFKNTSKLGVRLSRRNAQLNELLRTCDIIEDDLYLIPIKESVFSSIFCDEQLRDAWFHFVQLPEEKQRRILDGSYRKKGKGKGKGKSRPKVCPASERFKAIPLSTRKILRKGGFSMDLLCQLEDDIIQFIKSEQEYDYCDMVEALSEEENDYDLCSLGEQKEKKKKVSGKLVWNIDDPFIRLLAHGLCQYYNLNSRSETKNQMRLTLVTSKSNGRHITPTLRLTEYILTQ